MNKFDKYCSESPWLKKTVLIINLVMLLIFLMLSFVGFYEWFNVFLLSNPDRVQGYHFGAESIRSIGGFIYRSASIYSWVNFFIGCISLISFYLSLSIFYTEKFHRILFNVIFIIIIVVFF